MNCVFSSVETELPLCSPETWPMWLMTETNPPSGSRSSVTYAALRTMSYESTPLFSSVYSHWYIWQIYLLLSSFWFFWFLSISFLDFIKWFAWDFFTWGCAVCERCSAAWKIRSWGHLCLHKVRRAVTCVLYLWWKSLKSLRPGFWHRVKPREFGQNTIRILFLSGLHGGLFIFRTRRVQ